MNVHYQPLHVISIFCANARTGKGLPDSSHSKITHIDIMAGLEVDFCRAEAIIPITR